VAQGHFTIKAYPDQIESAGKGLIALGNQLTTRSAQVTNTPGEISKEQWSGAARDAVTTEMTALGAQMTRFGPMFEAAGQALVTLAGTVRTAMDTTLVNLNSRWEGAQDTYRSAVTKANSAYDQDAGDVPAEVTGTARTATMQGLQSTRQSAISSAESVRAGTEGQLNREFNTLISTLEAEFKSASSTLAANTLVAVDDKTVSDFVAAGGNGTRIGWTDPDGNPFPPPLGVRNALGKDLALYDDLRALEDGRRAADLGNRIKDPNHQPTKAELDELNKLLATNRDEKPFAAEFLNGVGPRGLLELNGRIATLQGDNPVAQRGDGPLWDDELAGTVQSLQQNLGFVLATGTREPGGENQVSWQWVGDLTRLGREKFTIGPTDEYNEKSPEGLKQSQVYGYQLLGPLLRNGSYGAGFIAFVGGDMLDFEMSQKGDDKDKSKVWNTRLGPTRLDWTSGHGSYAESGYDPVAGLMVALKGSPEGARQLLAGVTVHEHGKPTRLPRVDYLLTDREWPDDRLGLNPDDHDDKDWHTYQPAGLDRFGEVLEVATRDLDNRQAGQIVSSIVYELAVDEEALGRDNGDYDGKKTTVFSGVDVVPPQLRDSVSRIMSTWISSVHNGFDGGEGVPRDKETGDTDPYLPGVQPVMAEFAGNHLRMVLADLGKDEDAYTRVQNAELAYAAAAYDSVLSKGVNDETLTSIDVISRGVGGVFGTLDYGATAAGHATADAADGKHNTMINNRFAVGAVAMDSVGAAINEKVPVVGVAIGSTGNKLLDAWKQTLYQDSTGAVNYDVGIRIDNGALLTEQLVGAAIARNTPPDQLPAGLSSPDPAKWTKEDWDNWDLHTKTRRQGQAIGRGSEAYGDQYDATSTSLESFEAAR
jgi:hypothetical protein